MMNSAMGGYLQEINTLTAIDKKVSEQKFYTINIPDFIDIEVGNGAYNDNVFHYNVFDNVGDGAEGFAVETSNNSRLPSVEIEIDGKTYFRRMWNKKVEYTVIDLEKIRAINRNGGVNFDIIEQKLIARKKNFDLTLQEVLFNGIKIDKKITGLFNNTDVATDTTLIDNSISALNETDFNGFVGKMIGLYTSQSGYSQLQPDTLIMPYDDWLNLTSYNSITYPIMSKLEMLENCFKKATMNNNFKIMPTPMANKDLSVDNVNKYVLYKKSPDVLVLDLPVEYTTTAFASVNGNYVYGNVGYAQVGGVKILRPQEVLYFTSHN